jgi:hypothetical protein
VDKITSRVEPLADGSIIHIARGPRVVDSIHLGRNEVHAFITHNRGCGHGAVRPEIEDLGISYNLLTTASAGGRDFFAATGGGLIATGGQGSPATASGATSFTATGTPWTTNLLAGMQVVFPITSLTTTPVFGRIVSNTSSVATVDGWWQPDGSTAGTTPASTSAFVILPGGPPAKFMALTADASAANAANVSLTGELTTNGLGRKICTYAHTLATATYTLQAVFSATGTQAGIHRLGIFPFASASSAMMVFEAVLNADASVVNGDTLTVTDTVTVS